jgi:hypothetical protein
VTSEQREELVGAAVGVGADPDGVDPVRPQPAADEAGHKPGRAEFS